MYILFMIEKIAFDNKLWILTILKIEECIMSDSIYIEKTIVLQLAR